MTDSWVNGVVPAGAISGRTPDKTITARQREQIAERTALVDSVFRALLAEYYQGCDRYHRAEWADGSSRMRDFHRIRLGVLEKYGSLLAAALGEEEPDWEFMREQAEPTEVSGA